MIIKKIKIKDNIKYKILSKHKVRFSEIRQSILSENKLVRKTKDGRYIAVAKEQRYLTIIFEMDNDIAEIITAYPSSKWQIDLYNRRKK